MFTETFLNGTISNNVTKIWFIYFRGIYRILEWSFSNLPGNKNCLQFLLIFRYVWSLLSLWNMFIKGAWELFCCCCFLLSCQMFPDLKKVWEMMMHFRPVDPNPVCTL